MIDKLQKADCSGCGACASVCPKQCIVMRPDENGFWYPKIGEACIHCDKCEKACPALTPVQEDLQQPAVAYAVRSNNDAVRLKSSSGGVFSLLAEYVLNQGGIVFGAAFSSDFRSVRHIAVEDVKGLSALRGAKYVQSWIGNSYQKAEAALKQGRQVLFSGTPCQIEGLQSFLGRDYENLLCVDLICYGVPSPKVWDRYVDFRQEKASGAVIQMSFRSKKGVGWKKNRDFFKFSSKEEYRSPHNKDPYELAFQYHHLSIRPSCAQCHFKKLHRRSDITIGDFWGIEKVAPEMDDGKGTSHVLLHSERGIRAFEAIAAEATYQQVDFAAPFRKRNRTMIKSVTAHPRQAYFFKNLDKLPFDELVAKAARPPLPKRIKKYVAKKWKALREST